MRTLKKFFEVNIVLILSSVILTLIFTLSILTSGRNLGIQDWDQNLSYLEASRKSILEYKQFPLWNPFRCGGMPNFANPQSNILSINFLLVLIFGTIIGSKINVFVHYVIGFIGFYFLSKYFLKDKEASFFAAIVFTFSGVVSSAVGAGMPNFLLAFYIPFIFLFILKACQGVHRKRYLVLSTISITLLIYSGYHIALWLLPILFLYFLFLSLKEGKFFPIGNLILVLIASFVLSAPKLIASAEFVSERPRLVDEHSGYKIENLLYLMLSRRQNYHLDIPIQELNYGMDENSLYVGYVPVILLFLGLFSKAKEKLVLATTLIINIWFMLGDEVTISLWELLRKLPIYEYARVAQRFRFTFLLFICVFIGYGFSRFIKYVPKKLRKISILLIGVFVYLDLMTFSVNNFFSKTFIIRNPESDTITQKDFSGSISSFDFELKYDEKANLSENLYGDYSYVPWSNNYVAMRMGSNSIECYEPISIEKGSVLGVNEVDYRGEVFLLNNEGSATIKFWSPNRIIIRIDNLKGQDTLVLNQNYDDGWHVKTQNGIIKALEHRGLVAVELTNSPSEIIFEYKYPSLKDFLN